MFHSATYLIKRPVITRYLAIVLILALSLGAGVTIVGCSGSTETKIERDTVRVHDSLKIALVRFISMMPDNSGISLKLTNSVDAPIFATTLTATQAAYLPFVPDSAREFYLFSGTKFLDKISTSDKALRKGSVNTYGLFWFPDSVGPDGHIQAVGGDNNDSLKFVTPPAGCAMVRFINGNSYVPPGATDLDTESTAHAIATSTFAQPFPSYVPLPAGKHTLIVSRHDNQQAIDSLPPLVGVFQAGLFYTVRYIGDANHPPQLIIDAE